MAGRKPLLESELPLVTTALAEFCARDRALFILGLNTGFRISELLALNVGEVWDGERIRPQVKVTRAKLKGGRGLRRRGITSRTVPINEAATQVLQRCCHKVQRGRMDSIVHPVAQRLCRKEYLWRRKI